MLQRNKIAITFQFTAAKRLTSIRALNKIDIGSKGHLQISMAEEVLNGHLLQNTSFGAAIRY